MDDPNGTASLLAQAIRQGAKQGWNGNTSLRSRRLLGLMVCFQGWCFAGISVISLAAVAFGNNVSGNLTGAVIAGVVAVILIKLGSKVRQSALRP
jgi:hypothetical protein